MRPNTVVVFKNWPNLGLYLKQENYQRLQNRDSEKVKYINMWQILLFNTYLTTSLKYHILRGFDLLWIK